MPTPWRGPERVTADRVNTFAEGMATRVTFDLTFAILKEMLDDIVVLDEPELAEGVRAALQYTHNLAEGSGAAPLAAARKYRQKLAGKKIGCVISGGNIDMRTLARCMSFRRTETTCSPGSGSSGLLARTAEPCYAATAA